LEDLYKNNSYEGMKKIEVREEKALERNCQNLLHNYRRKRRNQSHVWLTLDIHFSIFNSVTSFVKIQSMIS